MMSDMDDSAFAGPTPVHGDLDVSWIHGSPRRRVRTDPPIQVHAYDEHTYLLRQSKDVTFEAPFVVLLLGDERALLLDTGATKDRTLRDTVDGLIAGWLATHPREIYPLVVAHTHGHGDHRAGDGQFADRPYTDVVGTDLDSVRQYFEFTDWPSQVVRFELGGRTLDITGTPGHHVTAVTIYDPWSGLLLTGDTVLPGRLLVEDMPAFLDSLRRMIELAEARDVTHVFGCHVEMTRTAGRDYPFAALYQPDELPPQLTVADLRAVQDAAEKVAGERGVHPFGTFVVYNDPGKVALAKQAARALAFRLRRRLSR
jgi:glyoxylase-like metal-dependent hydrolase (beta-lactamase superfamily II)